MNVAVVIPVGPDRLENLQQVLVALQNQTIKPAVAVMVLDGFDPPSFSGDFAFPLVVGRIPKHEPGREQPRNVGVRWAMEYNGDEGEVYPDPTHVWFLDSDVIVEPDCLEQIVAAYAMDDEDQRIMCCPYDWLPPGERQPIHDLYNDPRVPSFSMYEPDQLLRGDLAAGLACFSGNLVWPVDEFIRVGGFWNELHHGRCEDGELGLRAVSMQVPISFAREARGWHLEHPVNMELSIQRNQRDVPMLNDRHPWVERGAVFLSDRDGKSFDVTCGYCGETVHTIQWWNHAALCSGDLSLGV